MPREHSKGKQPSVEPADYEEEDAGEGNRGEGTSGKISRELVSSTAIKHLSIPGFSAVQVHDDYDGCKDPNIGPTFRS